MASNSNESVQRFATHSVHSIRHLPYLNRLRDLGLVPLKFRRLREDLIRLYKCVMGNLELKRHSARGIDSSAQGFTKFQFSMRRGQNKYGRTFLTQRLCSCSNMLP